MNRILLLCLALHLTARALPAQPPASAPDSEKIVVAVAPFASTGDDGAWAKAVAEAFYLKLVRWPGTAPIDRFTYADLADSEHLTARWDSPVPELAKFTSETLVAKMLIYGEVAVTDAKAGVMTLRVRAIDLRAGPVLAADRKFEISYPTQIRPAVEAVLNQLVGYSSINMEVPALVKLTPAMEQRWTDGPNLVPNPDFDEGLGMSNSTTSTRTTETTPPKATTTEATTTASNANRLARWEIVVGDKRYFPPRLDGATAPLVNDPLRQGWWAIDPADPKKRALHLAISEDVAASYGVACYSDWIPITPGCVYRFACRWRTDGPTPKVFIKGYAFRPAAGEKVAGPGGASGLGGSVGWQRREVYRRQVHPTSEADPKRDLGNGWTDTTADFCPRHDQTPPHWVRIDLYAYWPKGHVWFSHVVLKQLSDRPVVEQHDPADLPKNP